MEFGNYLFFLVYPRMLYADTQCRMRADQICSTATTPLHLMHAEHSVHSWDSTLWIFKLAQSNGRAHAIRQHQHFFGHYEAALTATPYKAIFEIRKANALRFETYTRWLKRCYAAVSRSHYPHRHSVAQRTHSSTALTNTRALTHTSGVFDTVLRSKIFIARIIRNVTEPETLTYIERELHLGRHRNSRNLFLSQDTQIDQICPDIECVI